jgi:hypothetical protein
MGDFADFEQPVSIFSVQLPRAIFPPVLDGARKWFT